MVGVSTSAKVGEEAWNVRGETVREGTLGGVSNIAEVDNEAWHVRGGTVRGGTLTNSLSNL